jgi:hypothetical protein
MKQAYETEQGQFKAEHPNLSAWSELGGGLTTAFALPSIGPFGAMLKSHPIAGSVAGGLGLGALYGGGTAPTLEEMPEQMAKQGALAGALGGAFPVVGRIAGPLTKSALQKSLPAAKQAKSLVLEYLKRDYMTPQQLSSQFRQMGPQAALTDVAGPNIKLLTESTITMPGRPRTMAEALHTSRMTGIGNRLEADLRAITGTTGKAYSTAQEILKHRKAEAAPLYEAARKQKVPSQAVEQVADQIDAAIVEYVNTPIASALKNARRMLFDADGAPKSTIGQLDAVKKAWDRIINIEKQRQGMPRSGASAVLPELSRAKEALLAAMDKHSKQYAAARGIWSDDSAVLDALRSGTNILKTDAERTAEFMTTMSTAEREAYRVGAVSAIRDRIMMNMRDPQQLIKERMRPLFNDERSFQLFMRAFAREKSFAALGQLLHGSPTARRLTGIEDVVSLADATSAAMHGHNGVALTNVIRRVTRKEFSDELREELGRLLLTPGKGKEIVDLLKRKNKTDEQIADLLTRIHMGASLETSKTMR